VNVADEGARAAARRGGVASPPADGHTAVLEVPGRLQPLLLAASVALLVPYLVAVAAPWPFVVVAAVFVGWGLLIAWQRRHGGLDPHRTLLLGRVESVAGAAGYVLLLVVDGGRQPTATILLAAGIIATVAVLEPPPLRFAVQFVPVVAAGVAVGLGRSWLDGAFVAVLLGVVAVLANAYGAERLAVAAVHDRARQDSERRARLLEAIGDLSDDDAREAACAVVATLRQLAYDAAAVELVRDDHLEVLAIDGMAPLPSPRRGQGIGWQAIEERRTVSTDRYPRSARRLAGREGVHAGVATPIVVDGEPVGCLVGLREAAEAATEAEMEIAEVLALHLGGVLTRLGRERWQRAQLDQLERLRHLHAELAVALGVELRGPLTEFRALGAAVTQAAPADQHALVDRFAQRTEDVLRTVETVLDVGRSQTTTGVPIRRPIDVSDLLDPVARATGAELVAADRRLSPRAGQVEVVATFVQRALELLLRSGSASAALAPAVYLVVDTTAAHVVVSVERDAGAPTGVARAVAGRLLRSAGAELEPGDVLRVRLPHADLSQNAAVGSVGVLA
jgi:hypothetical protein